MRSYPKSKMKRAPAHPGEILKRLWLDELGLSQSSFSEALVAADRGRVKKSTMQTKINELISGKRGMSAELAVLISKVLGTSPKMWMSLQVNLDLWYAQNSKDVA